MKETNFGSKKMKMPLLPHDTDKTWEFFGATDPYFGVWTLEDFRSDRLDLVTRERFFSSGQQHIHLMLQTVRALFDSDFKPRRSLDFGCGVGRLAIPLAAASESVVGADISKSMLAEAQLNCRQFGVENVTLVASDEALSEIKGQFDFIHSYIVFQHIPPVRGEAIMRRLIDRLEEGGIGVLHFTYSDQQKSSRWKRLRKWAYMSIPFLFNLRNVFRGRPFNEPIMQIYTYNVNKLLDVLLEKGCHQCHLRFTGHGHHGVILFFRKKPMELL
jgi:ubiquinone/menaquinone biosynthesis C-methylase UbiE